ncbi:YacL family protein [Vibrio salinus]|uniref:UPF0231 family protein n=1 Tax=Vibrio salinus TaxID=2899784 RepID=UPI001E4E4D03|nr:YacL family protein [Vibrio salinus]MCE0493346.1 YacL family protein [Vibrio salinus]
MDFEFTKNTMLGEFRAHFEMEHTIFGRLLEDELIQDCAKIEQLFLLAGQAHRAPIRDFKWCGTELLVLFHNYEVVVAENAVHQEIEENFEDNLYLYDSESSSSCGLEDFVELLNKWQTFIKS